MASCEILIKPSAVRELEDLPLKDRRRIATKTQVLSEDPRPRGCEKLTGQDHFRLRQGDYRILFEVDDPAATLTVVKIGHRGQVYR